MRQKVCSLKDAPPPGTQIYAKDSYSIHEVDGEQYKVRFRYIRLVTEEYMLNVNAPRSSIRKTCRSSANCSSIQSPSFTMLRPFCTICSSAQTRSQARVR